MTQNFNIGKLTTRKRLPRLPGTDLSQDGRHRTASHAPGSCRHDAREPQVSSEPAPKSQGGCSSLSRADNITPPSEGRLVPIVRGHFSAGSCARPQPDRLLRLKQVECLTGCRKSTLYRMMKQGRFPRSVEITPRLVAWSEADVQQWIEERITASQAPSSGR